MAGQIDINLFLSLVGLFLAVLTLTASIVVSWFKMGSILKEVKMEGQETKEGLCEHSESERLNYQSVITKLDKISTAQDEMRGKCFGNEHHLIGIESLIKEQRIANNYMEKVFEEIKRLVDNNTEVVKEIKNLIEKGYGSK